MSGPSIHLLVGHRGSGKTSFLKGLQRWAEDRSQPFLGVDLDVEISRRADQSIESLVRASESGFRERERLVLDELVQEAKARPRPWITVIAVGAGFTGPIPNGVRVHWIRRETDGWGRSFLNRPRLDMSVGPLDEYAARFASREARYCDWADDELLVPEGYEKGLEDWLMRCSHARVPFEITLLPENFKDLAVFLTERRHWGVRLWELREDLLSVSQLQEAIRLLPRGSFLYSRRLPTSAVESAAGWHEDWALELGPPPGILYSISRHERVTGVLTDDLRALEKYASRTEILKLAVEVRTFEELWEGHEWWLQDPKRRSFLPRSVDGRWRWYRSLFGPQMPLHFVREGMGSAADQPSLWQTWGQPSAGPNGFAAVLGHPVQHSRTPAEQREFFAERSMPVVAIAVEEHEFLQALPILQNLGLKCAAVTAPLKKIAKESSAVVSSDAERSGAVNTLLIKNNKVHGHNTDVLALEKWRQELPAFKSVWLWGGGGVIASVRAAWPELREFSARTGLPRDGGSIGPRPDLLIWAVSRDHPFVWPPSQVRSAQVLDLNYREDSPGLELAVRENLPYHSGLRMFNLQAQFQREYWARELGE